MTKGWCFERPESEDPTPLDFQWNPRDWGLVLCVLSSSEEILRKVWDVHVFIACVV
jgi:hypothetical protein